MLEAILLCARQSGPLKDGFGCFAKVLGIPDDEVPIFQSKSLEPNGLAMAEVFNFTTSVNHSGTLSQPPWYIDTISWEGNWSAKSHTNLYFFTCFIMRTYHSIM